MENGKVIWLYNLSLLKSIDTSNNSFAKVINRWFEEKVESGNSTFSQVGFKDFLNTAIEKTKENIEQSPIEIEDINVPDELIKDQTSQNKEPKSLFIKELSIKGFRKFKSHPDFTFILKPFTTTEDSDKISDDIPQSLFLIGENGVGKSSIYAAMEYVMTKQISEGEHRNKDFTPQGEEATLKLTTTDGSFANEKEIKNYYNGNSMLAIFCSENDIIQIGRKLNDLDNTQLFASMMGYNDIIEIINILSSFLPNNSTNEKDSSYKKLTEEIQKLKNERYKIQNNIIKLIQDEDILQETKKLIANIYTNIYKNIQKSIHTFSSKTYSKKQNLSPTDIEQLKKLYNKSVSLLNDNTIYSLSNSIYTKEEYEELKSDVELLNKFLHISTAPTKRSSISPQIGNPTLSLNPKEITKVLNRIRNAVLTIIMATPIIKEARNYERKTNILGEKEKEKNEILASINQVSNKNSLENYITLIKNTLYETIKKEYEPYKDFITSIMEQFQLPRENFSLSIDFNNNQLKFKVLNKEEGKQYPPSSFYNSFRYKLFCLLLKIACGLAYMKKRKIRIPIILDDVFYGSDFYSRTHIKQFFEILINQIKTTKEEDDKNNFIQIICFTHDEVILNAIMDVMSMENKNYIHPVFGRIIDAEYIVSNSLKKEGGIYINFNHYEQK